MSHLNKTWTDKTKSYFISGTQYDTVLYDDNKADLWIDMGYLLDSNYNFFLVKVISYAGNCYSAGGWIRMLSLTCDDLMLQSYNTFCKEDVVIPCVRHHASYQYKNMEFNESFVVRNWNGLKKNWRLMLPQLENQVGGHFSGHYRYWSLILQVTPLDDHFELVGRPIFSMKPYECFTYTICGDDIDQYIDLPIIPYNYEKYFIDVRNTMFNKNAINKTDASREYFYLLAYDWLEFTNNSSNVKEDASVLTFLIDVTDASNYKHQCGNADGAVGIVKNMNSAQRKRFRISLPWFEYVGIDADTIVDVPYWQTSINFYPII